MNTDIKRESSRIGNFLKSVHDLQSRTENVENKGTVIASGCTHNITDPLSDPDLSVTADRLSLSEGESISDKAHALIKAIGEDLYSSVNITGACRLPSRFQNRPGLVKISFRNRQQKVSVLRKKSCLRHSSDYKMWTLRAANRTLKG